MKMFRKRTQVIPERPEPQSMIRILMDDEVVAARHRAAEFELNIAEQAQQRAKRYEENS